MKIGVVGAGIIGQLVALNCVQQGWQVSLFEKNSLINDKNCSYAAGGMLTPFSELETAEHMIAELGFYSLKKWPTILNQLCDPIELNAYGSLILDHSPQNSELKKYQSQLEFKNISNQHYHLISQPYLSELEPEISGNFNQAIHLPNESCVSPPDVLSSISNTLQKLNVTIFENTSITLIKPHEITAGQQRYLFDWVIDCRGLGARSDLPQLRGVRGEIIWVDAPDVHLKHVIRALHPRQSVYIIPRQFPRYVIGASQIESEDTSPISVQTLIELLSGAYHIHRGFAEARVVKTLTQCRPALPDHLPRLTAQQGLIRVNGLFRHGYGIAPALSDAVLHFLDSNSSNRLFPSLWENL